MRAEFDNYDDIEELNVGIAREVILVPMSQLTQFMFDNKIGSDKIVQVSPLRGQVMPSSIFFRKHGSRLFLQDHEYRIQLFEIPTSDNPYEPPIHHPHKNHGLPAYLANGNLVICRIAGKYNTQEQSLEITSVFPHISRQIVTGLDDEGHVTIEYAPDTPSHVSPIALEEHLRWIGELCIQFIGPRYEQFEFGP